MWFISRGGSPFLFFFLLKGSSSWYSSFFFFQVLSRFSLRDVSETATAFVPSLFIFFLLLPKGVSAPESPRLCVHIYYYSDLSLMLFFLVPAQSLFFFFCGKQLLTSKTRQQTNKQQQQKRSFNNKNSSSQSRLRGWWVSFHEFGSNARAHVRVRVLSRADLLTEWVLPTLSHPSLPAFFLSTTLALSVIKKRNDVAWCGGAALSFFSDPSLCLRIAPGFAERHVSNCGCTLKHSCKRKRRITWENYETSGEVFFYLCYKWEC